MNAKINKFIILCIKGLEKMHFPNENVFSASFCNINNRMQNLRNPSMEYKYSMNTFMGLYKAQLAGYEVPFDIQSDFHKLSKNVKEPYVQAEDVAATVWTAGSIGMQIPAPALSELESIMQDDAFLKSATSQTMSWLIFALLAAHGDYIKYAHKLVQYMSARYMDKETHLVRHKPSGFRSDWSSFAASCYTAYVFLYYAKICSNERVHNLGIKIARKLVELQGAQGQWPWYYYVPGGVVADYYQVYSVHQEAMAPLFLLEAIDQGYDEFRKPLIKGFKWILGENELGQSMVSTEHSLIWRSVVRNSQMEKCVRFARGLASKFFGYKSKPVSNDSLYINRECRSYELGWALWAFAGRTDFDELLNHQIFE